MNFPLYIAKRYFFSRKKQNAINIISWVAVIGVSAGTAALVIVLSVFNGFETLIHSLYNSFDPDIKITSVEGKVFTLSSDQYESLKHVEGVLDIAESLEEITLLRHQGRQHPAKMKGVSDNFSRVSGIDSMIVDGEFKLKDGNYNFAVLGQGVAYYLGTSIGDAVPISIYAPNRKSGISLNPQNAFKTKLIFPSGVFAIEQEFDVNYFFLPLEFVRKMLDYSDEVSALEIKLNEGADLKQTQEKIEQILGDEFDVLNRYQQNKTVYKVMQSEKWAIFAILSLILVIASFNIIGSIGMLVVDKRDDLLTLTMLGSDKKLINRIVMAEGWIITLFGAVSGFLLGLLICALQIKFGLVKLSGSGTFVINAYPVAINWGDLTAILGVVLLIGYFSSLIPALLINRKLLYYT